MTDEQKIRCHAIIHAASSGAGTVGAGLAQIPVSDSALIIPIQISMVIALGTVFGIQLSSTMAESSIATAAATMTGRGISQILVGWIPVIGNIANAVTAAGITETLGWAVAADFENRTKRQLKGGKKS